MGIYFSDLAGGCHSLGHGVSLGQTSEKRHWSSQRAAACWKSKTRLLSKSYSSKSSSCVLARCWQCVRGAPQGWQNRDRVVTRLVLLQI